MNPDTINVVNALLATTDKYSKTAKSSDHFVMEALANIVYNPVKSADLSKRASRIINALNKADKLKSSEVVKSDPGKSTTSAPINDNAKNSPKQPLSDYDNDTSGCTERIKREYPELAKDSQAIERICSVVENQDISEFSKGSKEANQLVGGRNKVNVYSASSEKPAFLTILEYYQCGGTKDMPTSNNIKSALANIEGAMASEVTAEYLWNRLANRVNLRKQEEQKIKSGSLDSEPARYTCQKYRGLG